MSTSETALQRAKKFLVNWWHYVAVAVAGIILRSMVPMDIVWGSGHDSQLQVVLARNIADGYWLGSELVPEMWVGSQWNLALAKGVGYPLFLVGANVTGLTPVIVAYLMYLIGAFVVARSMAAWFGTYWGFGTFVVLTFSPAVFGGEFSRVYRNHLIAALALLALGLSLTLARRLAASRHADWDRRVLGRGFFLQVAALGICFGSLWVTRLDVHWIALACATPLCVAGWSLLRRIRTVVGTLLPFGATLLISAMVIPLTVATMNGVQYGIFATDDYGSGPIAETQLLLSKIEAPAVHPLVHVSAEQRAKAYDISPTLARIATQLEDPESPWKSNPVSAELAIKEAAGWFPWELRDAPVRAGLVSTLGELHDFFDDAEAELRAACESAALQCTAPGEFAPGVRFITEVDRRSFIDQFWIAMRVHSRGAGAPNFFNLSPLGIPELDRLWTDVVNGVDTVASPRQMTWPARFFARMSEFLVVGLLAVIGSACVALAIGRRRPRWPLVLVGIGAIVGTLVNAFIVTWFSLEIGVGVENNAGYLFAAQSFLYVGLIVLAAALLQPFLSRTQGVGSPDVPESA
jgi:hypothetical protein